MRRLLPFALVLALAPAAAAAPARERPVTGPISAVSIAGTDLAYADEYKKRCHEIRLWDVAARSDRRIATHSSGVRSSIKGRAAPMSPGE